MFQFKNKKRCTNDTLRQAVDKKNGTYKDVARVITSALYNELISEDAKNTIGIKTLYNKDTLSPCKMSEKSTAEERVCAHTEIYVLNKKVMTFAQAFRQESSTATATYFKSLKNASDLVATAHQGVSFSVPELDSLVKAIDEVDVDYTSPRVDVSANSIDVILEMLALTVSTLSINYGYAARLQNKYKK